MDGTGDHYYFSEIMWYSACADRALYAGRRNVWTRVVGSGEGKENGIEEKSGNNKVGG